MSTEQILANATERKNIKTVITEATHIMRTIEDQKDALSELLKETAKKHTIPLKQFKKVVKTAYKQNFAEVQGEQEEFEILYETLFVTQQKE